MQAPSGSQPVTGAFVGECEPNFLRRFQTFLRKPPREKCGKTA